MNLSGRLAKVEKSLRLETMDWREYARLNGLSERDVALEAQRLLDEGAHGYDAETVAEARRVIAQVLSEVK